MDGIVHVNGFKMELSPKDNFFGYSDSLLLSLFTTIHSEKPVAKVSGTFTVRYPDGSELRRPYEMPVNNLTEGDAALTLNRRFAYFNSEESHSRSWMTSAAARWTSRSRRSPSPMAARSNRKKSCKT